jgi:uncharacterized membrane protein
MKRLFISSLLLLSAGCGAGYTPPDGGQPGDAGAAYSSGSVCPTTQTLTYANFGQAFFNTHCQRCHRSTVAGAARNGAPDSRTFDTVESIRAQAALIDSMAAGGPTTVNTIMPPSDPRPTEADRRQLGEWLACGAP